MSVLAKIIKYYDSMEVTTNLSDNLIPVRAGMPRMNECSFQEYCQY